jgi:hypothetical protein
MKRLLSVVMLGAGLSLFLAATAQPAGAASRSQQLAFKNFAGQIRNGLKFCEAAAADTQILLGQAIQSKDPSQSLIVQLDNASKSAQTACDDTKDQNILNLVDVSPPGSISYIKSLGNVSANAEFWATDDTTAVLHDIQNFVESSSSHPTAIESQLETDIAQADSDAGSLRNAMNGAARRLGVKNYGGLGLIQWG